MKPKRQKHDYTSELELKSLLIRTKNKKQEKGFSHKYNSVINKYIRTFVKLNNTKYEKNSKKFRQKINLKAKLKDRIVILSEVTNINKFSHERFGEIILLMIKSILTKPNFSGYTYKTDFYSDAIHKILKYLHNFNHKLISVRSGTFVNSFAYISQIIHNSVVYIIKQKKKEQIEIAKQVSREIVDNNLNIIDHHKRNASTMDAGFEHSKEDIKEYRLGLDDNILASIKEILEDTVEGVKPVIYYPGAAHISMEDYNKIRPLLKTASIIQYK